MREPIGRERMWLNYPHTDRQTDRHDVGIERHAGIT
jgi:hypothetical protein